MKLEFHPEAELELIEAAFRYDLEVPGLGERFGTEVQRVTDLLLELSQHRQRGRLWAAEVLAAPISLHVDLRHVPGSSSRPGRCARPAPSRLLAVAKMTANQAIEGSAEQRRCSVPSSLRSSAPPRCQRWAARRCADKSGITLMTRANGQPLPS